MRKYLLTAIMLFALVALAACNDNGGMQEIPPAVTTQNEDNQTSTAHTQTPTEILPAPVEELIIQIDLATDEFLSTFSNLHHAHLNESGVDLVVWTNQPLPHVAVIVLEPEWLEDRDEWGFSPRDSFGYVEMLLPGEGYVINNYMGLGTLPHMGIGFFDAELGDTRIFFFQENYAYPGCMGEQFPEGTTSPEHGNRWVIQEIKQDRIVWGFAGGGVDTQIEGEYSIIINGVGFVVEPYDNAIGAAYTSAAITYTIAGEQYPTHVN